MQLMGVSRLRVRGYSSPWWFGAETAKWCEIHHCVPMHDASKMSKGETNIINYIIHYLQNISEPGFSIAPDLDLFLVPRHQKSACSSKEADGLRLSCGLPIPGPRCGPGGFLAGDNCGELERCLRDGPKRRKRQHNLGVVLGRQ